MNVGLAGADVNTSERSGASCLLRDEGPPRMEPCGIPNKAQQVPAIPTSRKSFSPRLRAFLGPVVEGHVT